jgi:type II secretory pathway pseudopilin PulG
MELLVALAILSILAVLALAGFVSYVQRSKTAEATGNLNELYQAAAALYARHTGAPGAPQGLGAHVVTNCIVPPNPISPSNPTPSKQRFPGGPSFTLMGHAISDYVYYGYGIDSVAPGPGMGCGYLASTAELYTFFARGDLDGDGTLSRFELACGSDADDTLYHARGFHIVNEFE